MLNAAVGLLIWGTLSLLKGEIYRHNDWRDVTPVIQSEVQRLDQQEMRSLLGRFCASGIQQFEKIGVRCSTGDLGAAFSDIVDKHFYPEAVIYGRFLSTSSEDAVVTGSSAETHPSLWGGTLLLTRRHGVWSPVWYKSAVITHSCQKVTTPSRREMLVCEDRDGGMGHQLHYVYAVDLLKLVDRRVSPLAAADLIQSSCVEHTQHLKRLNWDGHNFTLSITMMTPVWRRTSREPCAVDPGDSPRPPRQQTLVYQLVDTGFRRLPLRQPKTPVVFQNRVLEHFSIPPEEPGYQKLGQG